MRQFARRPDGGRCNNVKEKMTSLPKTRLFFCTNERSGDRKCCADSNAGALRKYAKQCVAPLREEGAPVKVKRSDCLGYCSRGPVIKVLPDNVFYTYADEKDIDAILKAHLETGGVVKRLLIGRKKKA